MIPCAMEINNVRSFTKSFICNPFTTKFPELQYAHTCKKENPVDLCPSSFWIRCVMFYKKEAFNSF